MIVFAQDKKSFLNSDRVDVFNVEFDETGKNQDGSLVGRWVLSADNYELGDFSKEKQAFRALNELAMAISSGQPSYVITKFDD